MNMDLPSLANFRLYSMQCWVHHPRLLRFEVEEQPAPACMRIVRRQLEMRGGSITPGLMDGLMKKSSVSSHYPICSTTPQHKHQVNK